MFDPAFPRLFEEFEDEESEEYMMPDPREQGPDGEEDQRFG